MSKDDIKIEIKRVLDGFSDKALEDLLTFLKGVDSKYPVSLLTVDKLKEILSEDKDLLQKLAH